MSGIHLWKASCADQPPLSARTHLREETQSSDTGTHTVCIPQVPSHAVEIKIWDNTSTETSH